MARSHGQNSHVQLKYIQEKGFKRRFMVVFAADMEREMIVAHLQTSRGVGGERFMGGKKEKRGFTVLVCGVGVLGLGVLLAYEHLSGEEKNALFVVAVDFGRHLSWNLRDLEVMKEKGFGCR
eukprot:TRINITY_DN4551_c0_g1_i2.p4 TRINITY_DN4551_c0_g1~~TRINITY_DN4551_c0_g1_i2.p4  ORF type:complete len:122 (-),score=36.16 TRINITY_DN4551_c0_g1_i2:301-666(-)